MKNALITGCNGFVGKWLLRHLTEQSIPVSGIDLQPSIAEPLPGCDYYQSDIIDASRMASIIAKKKPDVLFNLAGITFLPDADASPKSAFDANISGIMAILDALKSFSLSTRVLLIGSSREYANRYDASLIKELPPPEPANFYGISKYTGELIGLQYHRQFGLDIRCTRSFNHTGPGQSPRFVCSEWARHLARIELGKEVPEMSVGTLDPVIDFTDVRDVVNAYVCISENGTPGSVYNVCSGKGTSLQWILDYLINKVTAKVNIWQEAKKIRSGESSLRMIGDHGKLSDETGWKPALSFETTLDDLWKYWLQQEQAS